MLIVQCCDRSAFELQNCWCSQFLSGNYSVSQKSSLMYTETAQVPEFPACVL